MKILQEFTAECAHEPDTLEAYSGKQDHNDGHVEITASQPNRIAAVRLNRDEAIRFGRWLLDVCEADDTRIAAAFVEDRAHQYVESSGIHSALLELAAQLRDGDHMRAFEHGELDDLLKRREAVTA